jgi:NAD(P)-dependent dehydrogenase (short-subunit alcohol dehydrogenase family)
VSARTALVTGAAGTLGTAIAERLRRDGLRVAGTDLDGPGLVAAGDVADPQDVERICAAAEAAVGPIDALVNAAGAYGPRRTFRDTDPDAWWRVLEVNLRGPALLCRRLLGGMVERGRGHIVSLSSKAAVWDDPAHSSVAYATSKAALTRLTAALAGELQGTGVTVVDVSPGLVRTGMTSSRPDIDRIPAEWFLPPEAAAAHVAALLGGGYEVLHGHLVHAADDLDELCARVAADPRVRTLSLTPYGDDDPVT